MEKALLHVDSLAIEIAVAYDLSAKGVNNGDHTSGVFHRLIPLFASLVSSGGLGSGQAGGKSDISMMASQSGSL
jgi:hypothetical protein